MALGALSLAKRRGLKVPEDLSIIGFDNISLSEFCDPPLTTVSQPRFDIGREAMLLYWINCTATASAAGHDCSTASLSFAAVRAKSEHNLQAFGPALLVKGPPLK